MRRILLSLGLCLLAGAVRADTRISANYALTTEAHESGGRATSANYSIDAGVGAAAGGLSAVAAPAETLKSGYLGQLYDLIALEISAPPSNNLNETASRQLFAAPIADDATKLAALNSTAVTWSIGSGPIASISTAGLALASNVYQDTPASVGGTAQGLAGLLGLTILNVTQDDFGPYANDQIDDSWQVQYFGLNNPNAGPAADPDRDGQNNLFEFTAGLLPNDPISRFQVRSEAVPGNSSQKRIVFSPRLNDRTYTVQFRPSLTSATWNPLGSQSQSDNDQERTVTDLSATGAGKFYRVQIAKP